jgi:hypothetical protein
LEKKIEFDEKMASVKTEEKTHENLSKRQLLYNIRKYEI